VEAHGGPTPHDEVGETSTEPDIFLSRGAHNEDAGSVDFEIADDADVDELSLAIQNRQHACANMHITHTTTTTITNNTCTTYNRIEALINHGHG